MLRRPLGTQESVYRARTDVKGYSRPVIVSDRRVLLQHFGNDVVFEEASKRDGPSSRTRYQYRTTTVVPSTTEEVFAQQSCTQSCRTRTGRSDENRLSVDGVPSMSYFPNPIYLDFPRSDVTRSVRSSWFTVGYCSVSRNKEYKVDQR